MKQITILNQFFKFRGKLGTQFCTAVKTDLNLNVTEVSYISVTNTKTLPADWQNSKKQHITTAIQTIEPIVQSLNGLGMSYTPAASAVQVLNTVVPDSMGEEMHNALKQLQKSVGDVSGFVAERLQFSKEELAERLAAEQVDAVALSIYNIEARNQGFIIGDQTGVGKGRIAAAMIRYGIVHGHKPIFLTIKPNLFSDLYRDLADIGCDHYRPLIVNAKATDTVIKDPQGNILYQPADPKTQADIFKKATQDGHIPAEYDFIMATYSQFNSKDLTDKKLFLLRMAQDNICVLDEAHKAGGKSGEKDGTNTARYFLSVVERVKGIVYLSATFAKSPDNMPVYSLKTCVGEANLSADKLVEAIRKGGVALQEVLSSNIVKEGQMVRREKSKEHITVNYITLDKEGKKQFGVNDCEKRHKQALDSITELMRDIIEFQEKYILPIIDNLNKINAAANLNIEQRKGTEKMGVDNQDFASKTFNIIRSLLFSIKAGDVAERVLFNLKNGKKVVVAFGNTMESMLDSVGVEGDSINADYSVSLLKGLESTRRITEKDELGNSINAVSNSTGALDKAFADAKTPMDDCRELEQKYGLVPADQKQKQESLPLKKVDYKKGDVKHQIANVIRPVVKDYHFLSLKEYRALLSLYNVGVEEVRGEVNDKKYRGLVYSALDKKGKKVGNPFKSSLFGKSVGIENIEKRIKKSAEAIKNRKLKERSKLIIAEAMKNCKNRNGFEKALGKQGISVLFRTNDEGRIYGATFIDYEQKYVFNGSRLGKEFSANVFNELFKITVKPDKKQVFEPFRKSGGDFEENSGLGGIFSIFSPEQEDFPNEEMQLPYRKKKKRRRYGRQV